MSASSKNESPARATSDHIEDLYRTKQHKLRGFLRRYERDPDHLDDLIQEVFIEIVKSLSAYQGRSAFETWAFGIAVNVGRHHVARVTTHRSRFTEMPEVGGDDSGEPGAHGFMDSIIARERINRVEQVVRAMPLALELTFDAVFANGLSYRETADALDVPVGTVRSRTSRVRELLQDA